MLFSCLVAYLLCLLLAVAGRRNLAALAAGGWLFYAGSQLDLGIIDDAYISLHYARNFALGMGLVFNPGEFVEGYTCFLWVVLLSLPAELLPPTALPSVAIAAGVVATAIAIGIALEIADRLWPTQEPALRGGAALILALHFPLLFWAHTGMETGLFLALLLGANLGFVDWLGDPTRSRSLTLSSILLALAALTRPETLLLFSVHLPFLLGKPTRRTLRDLLRFALPFGLIVGAHLIWRLDYYGHPLPNTYYAKVQTPAENLAHGIDYLRKGFPPHLPWVLLIALRVVLRRRWGRVDLYLGGLALAILASVLLTGADHFGELRYFVYLWPYLFLLALPELEHWITALCRRLPERSLGRRIALAHATILVAILSFRAVYQYRELGTYAVSAFGGRDLAERLAELGRWLHDHSEAEDVIATPLVGAIAYYSERTTVDMLGLTDATVARSPTPVEAPRDHEHFDTQYVLGRKPRYIHLASGQPNEADFLALPHWIPAVEDLKRHLPRDEYEYLVAQPGRDPHALYRRIDRPAALAPGRPQASTKPAPGPGLDAPEGR